MVDVTAVFLSSTLSAAIVVFGLSGYGQKSVLHRCGVMWCKFESTQVSVMAITAKQQPPSKEGTRASVTFPADLYSELERISEEKRVSVAWVVRDAVEKYVEAQYPLFRRQQ